MAQQAAGNGAAAQVLHLFADGQPLAEETAGGGGVAGLTTALGLAAAGVVDGTPPELMVGDGRALLVELRA